MRKKKTHSFRISRRPVPGITTQLKQINKTAAFFDVIAKKKSLLDQPVLDLSNENLHKFDQWPISRYSLSPRMQDLCVKHSGRKSNYQPYCPQQSFRTLDKSRRSGHHSLAKAVKKAPQINRSSQLQTICGTQVGALSTLAILEQLENEQIEKLKWNPYRFNGFNSEIEESYEQQKASPSRPSYLKLRDLKHFNEEQLYDEIMDNHHYPQETYEEYNKWLLAKHVPYKPRSYNFNDKDQWKI